jgi:hypothetical protein
MKPLNPPPTLIVDAWAFRVVDKDGYVIGWQPGTVFPGGVDSAGIALATPPPGIERIVRVLPLDDSN